MSAPRVADTRDFTAPQFQGIVGAHPLMTALYDDISHAAPYRAPILIEGPTGTGKELVAKAVHALSGRTGPLVVVNVAELAEPLAEAELFGSTRGAFTGAVRDRRGLLLSADKGTLFLDEAGDLPPALQMKLLRVLETAHVRAVGGEQERPVSFRLLVSVQRPPWQLMAEARWRQDFYYRVAGITIRVPSLSERALDIPLLANHFLRELGAPSIPDGDFMSFRAHSWPGNVRELRRIIERAVHHARGKPVTRSDLEAALTQELGQVRAPASGAAKPKTLREMQREHIELTLSHVQGNARDAAAALGLSKSAFYRRIQELGIEPPVRHGRPVSPSSQQ